jgi:hypothetical protein
MPGASVEQAYAAFFVWHAEALAAHPPAEEAGVITRANGTLGLFLRSIAELCNGSTYDSDSYCLGSNPSSAATGWARIESCPVLLLGIDIMFNLLGANIII